MDIHIGDTGNRNFQFEFWNSNTEYPVRIKNKQLVPCLERKRGFVSAEPLSNPWIVTVYFNSTYICKYRHVLQRDKDGKPVVTVQPGQSPSKLKVGQSVTFTLPPPSENGPLMIRVYEYNRVDRFRIQQGWSRVADVAFSQAELKGGGTTKPVYSRTDLYYMETDPISRQHPDQPIYTDHDADQKFAGYFTIGAYMDKFRNAKRTGDVLEGHPVEHFRAILEKVQEERQALHEHRNEISQFSLSHSDKQEFHPYFLYIPGLPPVPEFGRYDGPVFTAQSFVYYNEAVTEEWVEQRTREILSIRGLTEKDFYRIVYAAKRSKTLTAEFTECLHIVNHVVRMHTCSRPYVPDHAWFPYKGGKLGLVAGDQETFPSGLPGDCEDDACMCYMIQMTLLLGIWKRGLALALQSCAAMMGIPATVSGTCVDPLKDRDGGKDYGHEFAVIIPFSVFFQMVNDGQEDPTLDFKFHAQFGFDVPMFHTKPVIMEGVYHTTMFYSQHRTVTKQKREALDKVKKWLKDQNEDMDDFWCWKHYTCELPMDNGHHAQGDAYRLFTDFLQYWSNSEDMRKSFIISKVNTEVTDEWLDLVFPLEDGTTRVGRTEPLPEDVAFVDQRVRATRNTDGHDAWGIPIELLGCEYQPVIRLHATGNFSKEFVEMEQVMRQYYDRPIVPLDVDMPDEFLENKVQVSEIPSTQGLPPSESNKRITVYAYDTRMDLNAIIKLKKALNAKNYWWFPYAFGYAIVFEL